MLKKINYYLLIVIISAAALRLISLSYSDYQGDEIKAFFDPSIVENPTQFLLEQRKGPVQFFITYVIHLLVGNFDNQLITRLPFALAGVLACIFFFKLVGDLFNEKVAFYSTTFFVTNGFLVAFSRIVQYQSFVILFGVLSLYLLSLANRTTKFRYWGVFLSFILMSLSLLSHYDGVFYAPIFLYLLFKWFHNDSFNLNSKLKTIFLSVTIAFIMLAIFYVPFALSISNSTKDYWEGRLTGEVSTKLSSSRYLFTVYQPIYVIHIYTGLVLLFAGVILAKLFMKLYGNKYSNQSLYRFRNYFIKIIQSASEAVSNNKTTIVVCAWFIIPFIFWEKLVYIPGTHIYTYLIPLFIFLGISVSAIEKVIKFLFGKYSALLFFYSGITIVFSFLFLQSFAIFVNNYDEYPWEEERFYYWTMSKPTPIFHLSMFGFPYYRDWESIRDFIENHADVDAYSTNERASIARYYIHLDKSSDEAGFYVYIKNPQSFTNEILSDKALYWANKNPPVYTFSRNSDNLVSIYLMPKGTLEELIEKGF